MPANFPNSSTLADTCLSAADEFRLAQQAAIEQLRLYSKHVPPSFVSSAVVSLLLTWFFWGALPPLQLGAWLAYQWLVLGIRYFDLHVSQAPPADDVGIRRRTRDIHWGVLLAGSGWGAGYVIMSQVPSLDHQVLIAVAIPSLCGAALGSVSMLPGAYPRFMLCIMIPFVVINLTQGNSVGYVLAALGTLFALTVFSVSQRISGMVTDTLRLSLQNGLLRERADASSRAKSAFLSSVSHELRTPLTSIRGFASLIEREFSRSFAPIADSDAKLRKKSGRIIDNIGIILKETERLTRLINDVLDLAKIESGKTEWRDVPLSFNKLVSDSVNAVQGMFEVKPGVALRQEIQPNLPLVVGDIDRLQQVLVNLLSNAAKFTEQGEVCVRVLLDGTEAIRVEVADTGSGFPQEDAEKIFDKFQQSTQSDTLTDKPQGTGLGLSIAREIVERHGGRIWATSVPGRGSIFAMTLPTANEKAVTKQVAAAPSEPGSVAPSPPTLLAMGEKK